MPYNPVSEDFGGDWSRRQGAEVENEKIGARCGCSSQSNPGAKTKETVKKELGAAQDEDEKEDHSNSEGESGLHVGSVKLGR